MVISRTPFRYQFIGGGTDLPAFYEKQQGAVIIYRHKQVRLHHGQPAF